MSKLKLIYARLNQMTDYTYSILRGTLMLSCTMVFCALVLFANSGGPTISGYEIYKCAQELFSLGAATMLVGAIGSVCIEESTMTRGK